MIHEINVPMQCTGGANAYANTPGTIGYNGMILELMAVTSPAQNHPELPERMFEGETEVIYIEGSLSHVRGMLKSWMDIIDMTEQHLCETAGPLRALGCPDCAPKTEGNHTWECLARTGDPVAQDMISKDPSMVETQREIIRRALS